MGFLELFDRTDYKKCIVCNIEKSANNFTVISGEFGICSECNRNLPAVPIGMTFDKGHKYLDYSMSAFFYKSPIKQLVYNLKNNKCTVYGNVFAEYMSIYLSAFIETGFSYDIIIPVPSSEDRLQSRGYNQTDILSKYISHKTGIPYSVKALDKIKETKVQSKLPVWERAINLKDAFRSSADEVKGKYVLLIDDVYTTGSTSNSCAESLCRAGAAGITLFSLARTGEIPKSPEYRELVRSN